MFYPDFSKTLKYAFVSPLFKFHILHVYDEEEQTVDTEYDCTMLYCHV